MRFDARGPSRRGVLGWTAAIAAGLAAPRAWAVKAAPAQLNDADKADVGRVEEYLNTIHTATAGFTQINDDGTIGRGQFYLQRPGKMRFQYTPPTQLLIVANHGFVEYYDGALNQTSYIPLGSTPLSLLLREQIKLSGEITLTRFERGPGTLRLTTVETDNPGQGSITLLFTERPFTLQQWTVLDTQNRSTRVGLADLRTNVPIEAKRFQFYDSKLFPGQGPPE